MTPNAIKILMALEKNDRLSKRKIESLFGFSPDYASYILKSLVQGGYIVMASKGLYNLLPKGADVLLDQLYHLENRLKRELARRQEEVEKVEQERNKLIEHKNRMASSYIEERI